MGGIETKPWEKRSEVLKNKVMNWEEKEVKQERGNYFCKRCGQHLKSKVVYCLTEDEYYKLCSRMRMLYGVLVFLCPNQECPNHHPSFLDEKF